MQAIEDALLTMVLVASLHWAEKHEDDEDTSEEAFALSDARLQVARHLGFY